MIEKNLINFISRNAKGRIRVNEGGLLDGISEALLEENTFELKHMSKDIRDVVLSVLSRSSTLKFNYEPFSAYDFERGIYEYGIKLSKVKRK